MFQIFMMLTNGAMCVMSTWSFAQSFYDNYNKKAAEIIKNPAVAVPSKLVHLGSGFMYHEHHSYSDNLSTVKLSGVIKSDEHEEVEIA
ncbi:MAG TPA: hypothetical protein QKA37_01910 [Candidatus Megaira endosymbiont of Stentor roeselii]|jgi:hypothetical protein|nr:hypothetical protein [Alphaproteobacteria bacterium]HJK85335.1 hypothetical protein [Candidatus Megaera endosymbiont of Stentor roeselii]